MPRVATKLAPADNGGFIARKVIPFDVRDDYAKLYRQRTEERLNTGPMPISLARAKHREWSSEIEARIANIRAERRGAGRTLTPQEARALAGEWYGWFTARMAANNWPASVWGDYDAQVRSELCGPAMAGGVFSGDPLDFWERDSGMRERVRPIIADEAKSHQFLAHKRLVLDQAARDMFLDYVTRDFFAALVLLARRARGDHSPDQWAEQFPHNEGAGDPGLTPWTLFERWIAKAQPANSTVDRWRAVFLQLQNDFPNVGAAALLPEQMHHWANGLISSDRTAATVANVWVPAARTVFGWAIDERLILRNPFIGWRVKVPKRIRTRETKAFTDDEMKTILDAAKTIEVRSKSDAAKRWCPWLAAYSGARMGELTQLRGVDIIQHDGIHAMKISPEAGTTKTGKTRTVPLHEHLIGQGFLAFVEINGKGPLFYNQPEQTNAPSDPTNPRKPRYVKAREQVASWVRSLGVNDPELSPNHAWRHAFKAIAFRSSISEKVLDAIVGHAPATVGRAYGEPTLADKANEIRKFPRYK
ncbi:MAG: tyrosine-type recombinase/integrase [Xanthobacteraceae bacterium]|jgi:integrase